ncbi:D-2-hydroxyacid dehydrogenase [Halomonas sp. CnH100-B]|uniref:D-2-hydroxyacid dehydrogenase n=1 Tax=Halomonas sp. CnH100-B TaxID=2954490 RepID=UPI000E89728F|nr:D-2-hydroxyacid dehydrogenase [Halomonas sp. CnH100-B]MCO7228163.1 D-2-hydroxyacid dehydrogenase [Halomonas sp. CnH100-B]HBM28344.1 glycerate dehydrogenase [Halomonas sp.]|tara:strand:+ start:630 stop:1580 length:951 start_codon:yes stop_codon:yes gene_type:complete
MSQAVILDAQSLGPDIDLTAIRNAVTHLEIHQQSTTAQACERLAKADIAIVNKVKLDAETLAQLPSLRLICVLATGLNNIDLEAAKAHGIVVKNVSAYGTASVSQHTLMLMLSLANRLPRYQADIADGKWQNSDFFCLQDHPTLQLSGKQLVMVGQGELGSEVARLAEAFGMQVTFAARPGNEQNDQRPSLDELLPTADVISLHCPLNEATKHLLDKARLAKAKSSLLIVNCARGGIIDEVAALEALRNGDIGGLAVDVLPAEPPRDGHPLLDALANAEPLNLIVTPHNAWITPEARQNIVALTADNIRAWQTENH